MYSEAMFEMVVVVVIPRARSEEMFNGFFSQVLVLFLGKCLMVFFW